MQRMIRAGLLAVIVLTSPVGAAEAPYSIQVVPLGFADPEATQQTLRDLYGSDAGFQVHRLDNRLVIRAAPEQQKQIADLIRQLDIRPKNIQISVRMNQHGQDESHGASLHGQGRVVIGSDGAHGTLRIDPRLHSRSSSRQENTVQILTAMSGRSASLVVGERVPYLEWLMEYGRRGGMVSGQIAWDQVGASLAFEPQVIGDGPMIRIRVVPELSGRADGHPERVRFTKAATEVTVRDGETVKLGGLQGDEAFTSRFLIGMESSGSSSSLDITLTPRILP